MLFNHFEPPLSDLVAYTSVHARFASAISDYLAASLPAGYLVGPEVRRRHEIDIVTIESASDTPAGFLLPPGDDWQPVATVPPPTARFPLHVE